MATRMATTTRHLWKRSSQSRKLVFFLLSLGFLWGSVTLLHATGRRRVSSAAAMLRRQVLDLGERYTEALAKETQRSSVFLDNIKLWRQGALESTVNLDDREKSRPPPPPDGFPRCPGSTRRTKTLAEDQAEIRTTFEELLRAMDGRKDLRWMRLRLESMEKPWVSAARSLAAKQNLAKRRRRKILLHLGLISRYNMAAAAFSGGPVGELVQWSDLIATLYVLGHDVHISASLAELKEKASCHAQGDEPVELIYIDIAGLQDFNATLGPSWVQYQCMIRVLDSFGTEPAFNHAHYAQSNGLQKNPWGMWNLNPQQFYTLFPHTPDNSFLGFVVEKQQSDAGDIRHDGDVKKQNQALVYGKLPVYWKDKKKYLDIVHRHMEVHATVQGTKHVPDYVKNHGILNRRDLQLLLRESKLFVGMSDLTLEGPAPLEAIANGCAYLNPKFNPPKGWKDKPTTRKVTSQHPYAEVYIGQPHVWTVDIENSAEVEGAIRSILSQKIEPYLPYEFTCEGMLQRVNAFIEKQDFCHGRVTWPPLSALQVRPAEPGRSCTQECQESQLICEPSFFQHLNSHEGLARFGTVDCRTTESSADTAVPAYSESRRHCVFQSDQLLFSCAGAHASLTRVCPCRDYMKGQVALCKDCL